MDREAFFSFHGKIISKKLFGVSLHQKIIHYAVIFFFYSAVISSKANALGVSEVKSGINWTCIKYQGIFVDLDYEGERGTCGPSLSFNLSLGLNLWGENYRKYTPFGETKNISEDERPYLFDGNGRWLEIFFHNPLAGFAVVLFLFTLNSVFTAIVFPFSSRFDLGVSLEVEKYNLSREHVIGDSLFQGAGLWFLLFPSQKLPLYLTSETMVKKFIDEPALGYSYGMDSTDTLVVRSFGAGLMSPRDFGVFVQLKYKDVGFLNPDLNTILRDNIEAVTFQKSLVNDINTLAFEFGYRKKF